MTIKKKKQEHFLLYQSEYNFRDNDMSSRHRCGPPEQTFIQAKLNAKYFYAK